MKRLETSAITVTESLERGELEGVINDLFLRHINAEDERFELPPIEGGGDLITIGEIKSIIKDINNQRSAPGPDGVPLSVVSAIMSAAPEEIRGTRNI